MARLVISQLAIIGAQARIKELEEELAEAKAMLRQLTGEARRPKLSGEKKPRKARRTKKRQMTPEAREAASQRMKTYWAAKKQQG